MLPFIILVDLLAIFIEGSMGAALGLLGGLFAIVLVKITRYNFFLGLSLLAIACLLIAGILAQINSHLPRTLAVRSEIWEVSLRLFQDHPLAGIGIGNFPDEAKRFPIYEPNMPAGTTTEYRDLYYIIPVNHAHNLYLHQWVEMGVVGGTLMNGFFLLQLAFCISIEWKNHLISLQAC
ncbi:MAG: O-antigen ligase family protein [Cytophagales bacterium]|nr:O-antigen ligase family protein [Cytophagales bacterium]